MNTSSLYDHIAQLIADRDRTAQAEARRLYELTKAEVRACFLKKVGQLVSELTPYTAYTMSEVTFDATCDTWRLEVGGFAFSQSLSPANIHAELLPPICTEGCEEAIITTDDLITLVSRHLSFPHHAETRAAA